MSDSETSPEPSEPRAAPTEPSPPAGGAHDPPPPAGERRDPSEPSRRGALKALAVVGGCAYAGALAVPSLPFLVSSPSSPEGTAEPSGGEGTWLRVAKLDRLKEGVPERVKLVGDQRDAFTVSKNQTIGSIWLIKKGAGVRAMSAECPHLGCAIDLRPSGEAFTCPCHTSDFSLDGNPNQGPAPRPMDELAARITDDGFVEVDFRRFRQGLKEKVEV